MKGASCRARDRKLRRRWNLVVGDPAAQALGFIPSPSDLPRHWPPRCFALLCPPPHLCPLTLPSPITGHTNTRFAHCAMGLAVPLCCRSQFAHPTRKRARRASIRTPLRSLRISASVRARVHGGRAAVGQPTAADGAGAAMSPLSRSAAVAHSTTDPQPQSSMAHTRAAVDLCAAATWQSHTHRSPRHSPRAPSLPSLPPPLCDTMGDHKFKRMIVW